MKLSELLIEEDVQLELAPLIDVLFLIVLFYAVSSSLISPEDLARLKGSLASAQSENRVLVEDQQVRTGRIALLERDLADRAERISRLESDLGAVNARILVAASQLDQERERSYRLDRDLSSIRGDLADRESRLTRSDQELMVIRQAAAEREARLARLEGDLADREARLADRDLRLSRSDQDLNTTRQAMAEREARLARLEGELEARTRALEEHARRIVLSDQALDAVRDQLKAAQSAAEEQARRRGEAEEALRGGEAERSRLTQALSEEKGRHDADLARLSAELAATRVDAERLSGENTRLNGLEKLGQERVARMIEAEKRLNDNLKSLIDDKTLGVTRVNDRLVLELSDKILFDSGSDEMKPQGLPVLENVARVLAQRVASVQIEIGGHTDNVPLGPSNRLGSNWALSAARAVRVVRFFESRGGIEPGRLAAVGYGEFRPVAGNDTPEGRSRNRRIEIVLLAK
jgi:chemotaxis protein MotB